MTKVKKENEGEIIMGDYLEEIIDNNDLEMDILAALDDDRISDEYPFYMDLPEDTDIMDELDVDYYTGA
jgi:hypothetical protein